MTHFTPTQGRYLSFIAAYINLHGRSPSEAEIRAALNVTPPTVNSMVRRLEQAGLIERQAGVSRSIRLLIPEDEIPPFRRDSEVD